MKKVYSKNKLSQNTLWSKIKNHPITSKKNKKSSPATHFLIIIVRSLSFQDKPYYLDYKLLIRVYRKDKRKQETKDKTNRQKKTRDKR